MGLESTMICVDTSEYMRNGDFVPTRMQAQQDAVYLVCRSKSRAHPENDMGLLIMANVRVLVTLTTDVEKLLVTLNKQTPQGDLDFLRALMVAQLALKNRQEKRHKMKIVAFVGSPIRNTDEQLVTLAKRLRKGSVSVDVVSFGAEAEVANRTLLTMFIDTLNGKEGGNSNLLIVTSGPFLTGSLVTSAIVLGEDGSRALPGDEYEWEVDANEDPELALALKMSLAEYRRNEEAEAAKMQELEGASSSQHGGGTANADLPAAMAQDPQNMTEEEQIAYALQQSAAEKSAATDVHEDMTEDDFLKLLGELLSLDEEDDEWQEENDENNKKNSK